MSCFGGYDEQNYLIEILVDKLTLTPGKLKGIGEHRIVIKIKFLDLPVFEITREDLDATKAGTGEQNTSMRFMIGKCCVFVKRPRDLVQELRSTSVKIGVFRLGDTYPTAETELTLPGCLCDQIAMIRNDPNNPPRPFSVKGGFHLLDPGGNPSGTLHMQLFLTYLGRIIVPQHKLCPIVPGERSKDIEICVNRFVPPELLAEDVTPQITQEKDITEKPPKDKGKKKGPKKKKGKK